MNLTERAEKLAELGFFRSKIDPKALAAAAERTGVDPKQAPATALLLAGQSLLEINADAVIELEDYEPLLKRIEEFCGGVFRVSKVSAQVLERTSESSDGDSEVPDALRLRFSLDGRAVESILSDFDDEIDLGFLNEIEEHLEAIGEPRRLCPLLELMDDTARYVFIEPDKVDQAELADLIEAPDFED